MYILQFTEGACYNTKHEWITYRHWAEPNLTTTCYYVPGCRTIQVSPRIGRDGQAITFQVLDDMENPADGIQLSSNVMGIDGNIASIAPVDQLPNLDITIDAENLEE